MASERETAQALTIHDLRLRLEEAEDVLAAIRRGEVDALVIKSGARPQVWSLNGVDHVYRVLFETLNEGALTLSEEGTILYSNSQFARLLEVPLQQVLGAAFAGFVAPLDVELLQMLLKRGLRSDSKGELRLLACGGTEVPVMLSLNAVEIEGVGRTCTVVVSDLTELKRAQHALVEANEALGARVEERTAALRLEIAERTRLAEHLAEVDQRKNEFLAMLGHELRNPLAPLLTGVELIRLHCRDNPEVERARAVMERQLRHMARLVDDLLDVSRITRGSIELQRTRVDLAAVVDAAVSTCLPSLDASGHSLELGLPDAPCWVDGDVTRLEQVVMNLISNAAKYSPAGSTIRVSLAQRGTDAELAVRDHGRGIPPAMLERIFDLFTQVQAPIDRSLGGLGIGLTVVKNLVQLHGGTVRARSGGEGLGSEFLVRLPLAPSEARRDASVGPAPAADPGKLRVLVVEDNADAAETLAELLQLWGHTVQVADRGEIAAEMALALRPEVVLLDIGLPGMDGYAVAEELRRHPALEGTLRVALTGYGQEADRRHSDAAGFHLHLTKPIDPEQLRALLRDVDQHPARKPGSAASRTPAGIGPGR